MCAPVLVQRDLFFPEKREQFFVNYRGAADKIIKLNKLYKFFIPKIAISCLIELMHNIQ